MNSNTRTVLDRPGWAVGMDLAYDFVGARKFGPALPPTDTHASTIYAPNAAGVYAPFAANVLTRTDLGLQTVPTRTNSIRNNSMVGAVAGVIGSGGALPTNWLSSASGLTRTVVGTGTEDGLPYVDVRLNGTTGSIACQIFFEVSTQIAAVTAQTWASSFGCKLVGGSLANISFVDNVVYEWTAAGAYINEVGVSFTPSASRQATSQAKTLNGGGTTAFTSNALQLRYSAAVAIDITLRIYAPQYELGAFASAPILTTGSAATVNGNQQVISLPTQLAVGVAGFIQVDLKNIGVSTLQILSFENIDNANALRIRNQSNNLAAQMINSSVSILTTSDGALATGIQTIAFAFSSAYQAIQIVGGALVSGNPGVYPSGLLRAGIGGNSHDAAANMYQYTRKLALKFGPQDAGTFAQMYDRAQLMAAS